MSRTVAVAGRLDEPLSRWLWLVKWLLLIPHYVVLFFLWIAFGVVVLIAFFAILFTGRFPRGLFSFNLGVLRWGWRVTYYGYSALGTDRYPPFTLGPAPDYPATLDVAYPATLSRGLVLVKWWLLALPHYLILGFVVSGGWAVARGVSPAGAWSITIGAGGLLGLIVFFAGVALLFTSRYPHGIFNLALGLDRWLFRVVAYVTLMTDEYPPFRLDQGPAEPGRGAQVPAADRTPAVASAEAAAPVAGASPGAPGAEGEPAPARRGAAGPVVALVIGLLCFVLACVLAGLAGTGLWLTSKRDPSGFVSTSERSFVTDTAAITIEDIDVPFDASTVVWSGWEEFGDVRIRATSAGENDIFIGIAPQSEVDAWLGGVAHDRVRGITGDHVALTDQPGVRRVVPPPVDQDFWDVQATGAGTQTIVWPVRSGRWAFVLANADGAPGIRASMDAGMSIPSLAGVSAALFAGAAVALIVAILLIALGATGLGRLHAERSAHEGTGGLPPPPPERDAA